MKYINNLNAKIFELLKMFTLKIVRKKPIAEGTNQTIFIKGTLVAVGAIMGVSPNPIIPPKL